jgi:hypothetical protein
MPSVLSLFRHAPTALLRRYFTQPELQVAEFDWCDAKLPARLAAAVQEMHPDTRDRVLNDVERVLALVDEPGQTALRGLLAARISRQF